MKNKNGITLVALVVTVIILLILAGISISILGGENGIINITKKATREYEINQAKEELQMAIMNLKIEEEGKGDKLDKEDLPRLNNDKIDVGNVSKFPVEIIYENFLFNVDEYYNVIYIGEADRTIITYTTEPEGYTNKDEVKILIKVSNSKGIKTIEYPDGDKLEVNGAIERGIDYTVTANGIYTFKIIDNKGNEIVKDVVIEQIDKLAPNDFEISATDISETGFTIIAQAEDKEADDVNVKSGIQKYEYFIKKEEENEYVKYNTDIISELTKGIYQVYVIAYDRAGNFKQSNTIKVEAKLIINFSEIDTKNAFLGIDNKGDLWSFGSGNYGQLGNGTTEYLAQIEKIKVEGIKFKDLSLGGRHSIALDVDGNIWSWGTNTKGQLGDSTTIDSYKPKKIEMGNIKFDKISAGEYYNLALDTEGNIYSWGANDKGQLGDGTIETSLIPKRIYINSEANVKFKEIAAGYYDCLAIDMNDNIWIWGNAYVGDGTTNKSKIPKKLVMENVKFNKISTYGEWCLAIDTDGNLWTWGDNYYGIGIKDKNVSYTPVKVYLSTDIKFKEVSACGGAVAALDENGNIWTCGYNGGGQLGNGTSGLSTCYTLGKRTTNNIFKDIEMGGSEMIAIDVEGNLWSTGEFIGLSTKYLEPVF